MFRYINMPKLVAFYLKEFSARSDGSPSNLYKFIFCLCLPFVSNTFNTARMIALGIAECTQSRDQITRLLKKITGADLTFAAYTDEFMCGFDSSNDSLVTLIPYTAVYSASGIYETPIIQYEPVPNAGSVTVNLNGYSRQQFESYAYLLIPFYTNFSLTYIV